MLLLSLLFVGSSLATYYQPAVAYTTAKPTYYYQQPAVQQQYYTTVKPYSYYPPTTTYAPYTTAKPYQETYTTQPYYSQPTTKSYYSPPSAPYAPAATAAVQQNYYSPTTKGYAAPSYTTAAPPQYYAKPQSYEQAGYDDPTGWYNYAFKFNVNDYYGNEQSRSESRENDLTRGQYSVNLPDGRKQVVSYEADQNGYRADVSYEPADGANSDPQNYYSTAAYTSGYWFLLFFFSLLPADNVPQLISHYGTFICVLSWPVNISTKNVNKTTFFSNSISNYSVATIIVWAHVIKPTFYCRHPGYNLSTYRFPWQ